MPKMNGVPDRWEQYSAVGSQILGTRLIAFKTPLKDTICAKLELKNRFSVEMLVKKIPDLGLIIDLTNTTRYYNSDEVLRLGVAYAKVACPGQRIPPDNVVHRFFSVIDTFLDKHPNDGKLVGVHCTHGVNRTGYLLSRYLIQRMGFKAKEAVECITSARGHLIERGPYIEDLHDHVKPVSKNTRSMEIVEPGNPAVHGGVRSGQGNDGGLADLSRQQQNNNWRNSSGRPNKMPENTGRRREASPDDGRPGKKGRFDGGGSAQPLPEPWSVKPPILQEASRKKDNWRHSGGDDGSGRGRGESSRFREDAGYVARSSEIPPPSHTALIFSRKSLQEPQPAPLAPAISRDVYVPQPSDFEKTRASGGGKDRGDRRDEPLSVRGRRRSESPSRRDIAAEESRRGRDRGREFDRIRSYHPPEPNRERPRESRVEQRRDGGLRDKEDRFDRLEPRRTPARVEREVSSERRRREPSPDFETNKTRYERNIEPSRHRYEERKEMMDPPLPVWEDSRVRRNSPRRSVSPRPRNNFSSDRARRNRSPEPTRVRRPSPHSGRSPDRYNNAPPHSRVLLDSRESPLRLRSSQARGRSPSPHRRARSPHLRGRSPSSPPRDRSPPPRVRSPLPPPRVRTPPLRRGRSPSPLRMSPPMRGRSPSLRNRSPPRGRSPSRHFRHSRDRSPFQKDILELAPGHRRQSPPSEFEQPPRRTRSPIMRRSRAPDAFNYLGESSRVSHPRGRTTGSPIHYRGSPPHVVQPHRRRSPRSPAHFRGSPDIHRSRSPRSIAQFRASPSRLARSRSSHSPAHFRGPSPLAYRGQWISPQRLPDVNIDEREPEIRYCSRSPSRGSFKRSVRERSPHQQQLPPGRNQSPLLVSRGMRGHSPLLLESTRREYEATIERSPRLLPRDLSPPLERYIREPPSRYAQNRSPRNVVHEFIEPRLSPSPPRSVRRRLEPPGHFSSRSPSLRIDHPQLVESRIVTESSPPPPSLQHHRYPRDRSPPPHRFREPSLSPSHPPHRARSPSPPPQSHSPVPVSSFHDRELSLSPPPTSRGGALPIDVPDCRILINQKRLGSSQTDPDESEVLRDDSLNDSVHDGPHHRHPNMPYHNNRRGRKPVFARLDKRWEVFDRLDQGGRRPRFRRYRR